MSILVIGDSFADCKTWNYDSNPHAWPNVLGKILNKDVKSIGKSGTSLEYTYQQFLNSFDKNKHETVIFIRTQKNRRHFSSSHYEIDFPFQHSGQSINEYLSPDELKLIKRKIPLNDLKTIIQGIEYSDLYFENTNDWKIQAITDAIQYRIDNELISIDFSTMSKISDLDHHFYNINRHEAYDSDSRPCHMNIVQNNIFANFMAQHICKENNIHNVLENINSTFKPAKTFESTGLHIIKK